MCIKLDCEHPNSTFASDRVMAPSVTLGSEPQKASAPPEDLPVHGSIVMKRPTPKEVSNIDPADDSAALQKAIALSLQDQQEPLPAYYNEEREGVEVTNPHERKRTLSIPVGLKNIGNSCWFNVVIQPLFHIPAFRNLIYSSPTVLEGEISHDDKAVRNKLVPTLRYLYSLLCASEKKYVDPSDCVSVFEDQEMIKNTQQDVCEFVHKLLQKLEEEFKLVLKQKGIEKESTEWKITEESDFENPIMQLFYGQMRKDHSEELGGAKLETFGLYPLTVQNCKDIHESILSSMVGQSNTESDSDIVEPINQDTWFKILPPVLIFSLSRYAYSIEKKRAEKVHNKFDFPNFLYMDRYMESNKMIVKEKHVKVAKLKQELKYLANTLEKYQKFGSGDGKYPITDILQYTLEFAQQDKTEYCISMEDEDGSSMDVDMTESNGSSMTAGTETPYDGDYSVFQGPTKKRRIVAPSPKDISQTELYTLRQCLPRWQKEMELKVAYLRKEIEALEVEIQSTYEDPLLQKIPYKLHAVVVHEGQAYGGHYWVYIYDNHLDSWLKFNDIQVCFSNWDELLENSIGGQNNASAYCLMYLDQTRYQRLFPPNASQAIVTDLPIDLQEYVKNHNIEFQKMIKEWDLDVEREKDFKVVPPTAPNSPENVCVNQSHTSFWLNIETMLNSLLENQLNNLSEVDCVNTSEWVRELLTRSIQRLRELSDHRNSSEHQIEPALVDFGIYLITNNATDKLIYWYALEVLWQQLQICATTCAQAILSETKNQLRMIKKECYQSLGSVFDGWKCHYENYVRCTWLFILGNQRYEERMFEQSCGFFINCLFYHYQIKDSAPRGPHKTLNADVLYVYHRSCLQKLNAQLVDCVKSTKNEEDLQKVEEFVRQFIIPGLHFLSKSDLKEDENSAEYIRNQWCELLSTVVTDASQNLLSDIISKIFNIANENYCRPKVKMPPYPSVLSLSKQYKDLSSIRQTRLLSRDAETSVL